jgi:two-component system, cell cycle sensor histidine kinase and response regulator CckA
VVTKSGEISWMQTSRIPLLDQHGNVTGYRGTSFDITARKQAEASQAELETRLRESQKMQAIGTLAGGIAHDFNNIIAAILGNVTLARLDAGPSSPAHESLNEIHKSASRARDLVKQILAFSKRQHTHFQPMPLDTLIVETVNMLRATLPARVAIEVKCDQTVPYAAIDKSQIQQVLINLATNAVQAMGGQPGHIRILLDATAPDEAAFKRHPSLREFCSKHPDSKVRLIVSDDGPGMPPDICLRAFDPFFTTKPVGEGTGLGLSVAHGIVQGHQGVIVVDSEPGAGTQFTICLPGCPAEHENASTPPLQRTRSEPEPAAPQVPRPGTPPPATKGGPHILYLDDDEALVSLVKRLLERIGYRVSAHHDQNAALEQVRTNPAGIDLVLSDYNMPGMSGLDVARRVREIRPDLPVAITSGFIDETLSEQAADVGISDLIFKADSVDEFCKAIAALLPARSA